MTFPVHVTSVSDEKLGGVQLPPDGEAQNDVSALRLLGGKSVRSVTTTFWLPGLVFVTFTSITVFGPARENSLVIEMLVSGVGVGTDVFVGVGVLVGGSCVGVFVGGSCVGSCVGGTAVGGSWVGGTAVGGTAVGGSCVGGTAVGGSCVGGTAVGGTGVDVGGRGDGRGVSVGGSGVFVDVGVGGTAVNVGVGVLVAGSGVGGTAVGGTAVGTRGVFDGATTAVGGNGVRLGCSIGVSRGGSAVDVGGFCDTLVVVAEARGTVGALTVVGVRVGTIATTPPVGVGWRGVVLGVGLKPVVETVGVVSTWAIGADVGRGVAVTNWVGTNV